ncbi:MAG: SBBP repeat-containing protein [Bacteroidota bacterium]|nr:SBBP repeat-containing protein [Bacteroidota bacterium]
MKRTYLFIAILFLSEIISASGIKQPVHSQFGFIENKGQIMDQNNIPNSTCLYLFNGGGLHVQLKQNSFSYEVWKRPERSAACLRSGYGRQGAESGIQDSISLGIHRVDVTFLNANKNPNIIPSDVASDYINYYTTGTPETGVTHVRHFKKVLYQNIYPNIDVEFVLNDQQQKGTPIAIGVKYNFIIHPGGNSKDIQIKFNGATSTSLNAEGNILIETAYGNIEESIPESYQMGSDNSKQKVTASFYTFHSSLFTFGICVGNYDASKTLIIDPWATYFGGSGGDYSNGIAIDGSGNCIITGYTGSASGIATSGAYQTSHGGGNDDAFIAKFSTYGVRQWASYYGGSWNDNGNGIVIDSSENIVITGHTGSLSGIATSGAYQTSFGGSVDAFIAKFNASGVRLWATYYGGSGTDYGYGIAIDGSGNIHISGYTSSTSGIATSGVYQSSYGGSYDAYIAKFNASGVRQWATYYGFSGDDFGYGIAVDSLGNMVITGHTYSISGFATSGAYQTSLVGNNDAFIAKFNAVGARLWATYYGGNGGENGLGIAVDDSGNMVITGNTSSTFGIATSGAYQTSTGGGFYDAYIVKFNASGARQWATYFGGSGSDNVRGIAADGSGNIVITGTTESTSGIATSGAYKTSHGGGTNDAFIAKFNASGVRQWATYYGSSGVDYGYGIAVKSIGNIIITGTTSSTSGIATSGAYQTTYVGGFDAFVASFTSSGGLPVKLISFDAKLLSNKQVLLSWQTASETNNDFFEVERRGDPELPGTPGTTGTSEDYWDIVGTVKGAGNSNLLRSYAFVDDIKTYAQSSPLSPLSHFTLYYRLKQIDYDGSYTYSKAVAVKLDEAMQNEPIIFPNPGNGNFIISTNHFIHELELFDPNGQSLLKMFDVTGTQQIHLSNDVKDGIYFLRIITDNGNMVKKIVVLR